MVYDMVITCALITYEVDLLLKVITPVIIIITFIIKEIITYRYFVKQNNQNRNDFNINLTNSIELAKKNWYLNVLVQPNIKVLNEFYDSTIEKINAEVENLKVQEKTVSHKDYLALATSKQREFKSKKRDLEFNFINLIRSSSTSIAKQLTDKVNLLDDLISTTLMTNIIADVHLDEIEKKMNLNKVELLTILFSYIENKNNS